MIKRFLALSRIKSLAKSIVFNSDVNKVELSARSGQSAFNDAVIDDVCNRGREHEKIK